jgi:hypothetical protein
MGIEEPWKEGRGVDVMAKGHKRRWVAKEI